MAGFVLLCVLVQALLIPAQWINERTHFHVSSSSSNSSSEGVWTPPAASQSEARAVFAHRRAAHDEALPHQHAALQDHDHGARADVVYVNDQEKTPSASLHATRTKRLALDHDGLWSALLPPLVVTVARIIHVKSAVLVGTRNEPPLERPPRV